MNAWIIAAVVLLLGGILPCLAVCARASALEGVVALEMTGTISVLVLLLLAEGFGRQPFFYLVLISAALSFVGALAYVRFMEREL
jgi:multicomponent Na+:H+ antiporter subunit F